MVNDWDFIQYKADGSVAPSIYYKYVDFNINIGGKNVENKQVYVYYYYQYGKKGNYAYDDVKYAGVVTAPTQITVAHWNKSDNEPKYVYVLFSDKPQNLDTIKTDIPQKHWYMFEYKNYGAFDGLRPYKADMVYYPGDKIQIADESTCSSSSDSCHHSESICYYENGNWDGRYHYQNHSGTVDMYVHIPDKRQNNRIYYALDGWGSEGRTYTNPVADNMKRIYTIYDNDLDKSDGYFPFSSPDVLRFKVNGSWISDTNLYVKANGTWKEPQDLYIKQNGSWVSLY